MPLTERDRSVFKEIQEWENQLLNYETNDLQLAYEKYLHRTFSLLPEKIQKQFFTVIDSWLFHLHGMIQSSQMQQDEKERILDSGRVFLKEVEKIEDMRQLEIDQLHYIAGQLIARHRLYSLVQGGLVGTGNKMLLGMDIPTLTFINLRVVQLIAMTYGFEVNTPFEMMTSLKVFHTACLPHRLQKQGWLELKQELELMENPYFYEGKEEITDINWIEQPLQQLLKAMVISQFRHKLIQGIPLFGIAIGAGVNYQLTRKVTSFAEKYYQLRYLYEKEEFSK
ncbi:EcsC family protein [Bacillus thermocopriae]|uniref:EcsC family protein n=1 Tax=Neobacillus thermocopriae TaxID=1215031 RepID=A0A6B3TQV1_9BACI|nr:EcsC family protein [Neobacillus thermocopriae]MED3622741.1 EcsC family protein [Neobacillus thermocopriae]MED3714177.1 EcsC family protein [Neobacillus thermocopriae]NEX78461.1 EcsC family protein [Neobacillus thermocopriae]